MYKEFPIVLDFVLLWRLLLLEICTGFAEKVFAVLFKVYL